jgi:ABC-type phosphate/phosphonate transport system substrate-binding protein
VVERQPPQPVASDEIGYYFAWTSRDQEVEDVMNGTAAAGGNSDEFINQLLGSPDHLPGIHKADLKILATVPGVMRRLVTARSGLDPRVRVALQDLLANMHTTPEGQRVLKSFGRASRFSRVDRETAFVGIAEHSELVDQELQKWREPTGGR